jgi:hypothetical protein
MRSTSWGVLRHVPEREQLVKRKPCSGSSLPFPHPVSNRNDSTAPLPLFVYTAFSVHSSCWFRPGFWIRYEWHSMCPFRIPPSVPPQRLS